MKGRSFRFNPISIRAKFLFLILGVTLIPFLVVSVIFVFQITGSSFRATYAKYIQCKYWVNRYLTNPSSGDVVSELKDIVDTRPRGLEILVVDNNDTVIFSTIEPFKDKNITGQRLISNVIRDYAEEYEFQIIPFRSSAFVSNESNSIGMKDHPEGSRDSGIFLVMTPRLSPMADFGFRATFKNIRFYTAIGVPLVLIIFTSVMSFYIIRSIRREIDTLEEATRRIANGDLDFSLEIRGRDKIASLARSFDMMRAKLKEEYARRSRLIMGISHDLKTPLALIEGYADAIADGYADKPDKLQRYISIVKEKSLLLEQRVAKLIDFVRLETGEWRLLHRDVVIREFLEGFCKRYREDASLLGFKFDYTLEIDGSTVISMDPELFQRALENLVSNAFRYSHGLKKIEFEAKEMKNRIVIKISNYGDFISEEEAKLLFEPFYRGSRSRREDGLGLGLNTVKTIVDLHGWKVSAKSEGINNTVSNSSKDVYRITFIIEIEKNREN